MPTHTTLSGRVTGARKATSDRGKTGSWAARALQRPEQERGAGWEQAGSPGHAGENLPQLQFLLSIFFRSINHQSQCENQGQLLSLTSEHGLIFIQCGFPSPYQVIHVHIKEFRRCRWE